MRRCGVKCKQCAPADGGAAKDAGVASRSKLHAGETALDVQFDGEYIGTALGGDVLGKVAACLTCVAGIYRLRIIYCFICRFRMM